MKISLIICTRNRIQLLKTCLQSIPQSSIDFHEVVVIDQSSDTANTEELLPIINNLRYIPTETQGLSWARNLGIKVSTGDIIAFTDDDCIMTDGWAEAIIKEFQRDPHIMAVYGRVLPFFNGLQPRKMLAIQLNNQHQEYKKLVNPWKFQSGNNMALRREVFAEIGYFDELLGPGAELRNCDDADMAYRLLRHGLRVVYTPKAIIYHRQWRGDGEAWRVEQDSHIGAGALFIKHLRYGDAYVFRLILERLIYRGIGNIILGILSCNKYKLRKGYYSLFVVKGMWQGLRKPLSSMDRIFITPN